MRNLKKFLALVLAMMMTLSLMVTVNAASDFTDADTVNEKFTEAVDVLEGMGVFEGYDDGSFQPKGNITRAEVATIVYRLATGDAEGKQAHLWEAAAAKFTDVGDDHWALGAIGYCANNLLVLGYDDGTFGPNKNVSGIEALAMILRAVGYGKNNEFKGWGWDTNVYGVARGEGLLKNVDNTNYASRLSQPATRELVAEVLFQAAQIPTVNYQYGSYNKYNNLITQDKEHENPSLGLQNYGLTCHYGIVLGNQATGEDEVTKIGFGFTYGKTAAEKTYNTTGSYKYDDSGESFTADAASFETVAFDAVTGLDLFGHKVKVWYDADSGATKNTYAMTDAAVLAVTLNATDAEQLTSTLADDDPADGKLAAKVKAAGFSLSTTAATFCESASFARLGAAADDAPTATTSKVYVVISNNSNKTVDVVIPVDCTATKVVQVDKYAKDPSITVNTTTDILTKHITSDKDAVKLGDKVVVTKISKSTADPANTNLRWIDNVTKTTKGTVVKVDEDTQEVTLKDGRTLKRSIIDNAAIIETADGADYNVDDNGAGLGTAGNNFAYTEYTFLLDGMGNWIHATKEYGTQFVYGTYLDYSTSLGTSSFDFRLVGVNAEGKMVTLDFDKFDGAAMLNTAVNQVGDANAATNADVQYVYYRSDDHAGRLGKTNAGYMGFAVDSNGNLWSEHADNVTADALRPSVLTPGFVRLDPSAGEATAAGSPISGTLADTEITKADLKLGVKALTGITTPLYLTEQTKFIVVEGYGTDTLKPVVYNGITELMGEADKVTIDIESTESWSEMMWANITPYIYGSTTTTANQVNTIFLPKAALKYASNVNDLFYVADGNETSNIVEPGVATDPAKLFTLHNMGEEVQVWLDKAAQDAIAADKFYTLEDSGDETATGEKIYTTEDVTDGAPGVERVSLKTENGGTSHKTAFMGTTNNGLTALITYNDGTPVAVNTANVVVKSLTDKTTAKDINELNELASVNATVQVALQYAEKGSNVVTCIYVVDVVKA